MQIRLQDLASLPGRCLCFDYTTDLSQEEVSFEHPFPQPVRLRGSVTDHSGVITLSAQAEARVHTHCARCGRPVEYDKATPVDFVLVRSLANGEDEQSDELFLVDSDTVELDDILIPEFILDMEMTVLCREDCKGLCPKCGKNLNEGPCGCDLRQIDPRLAVLQKLLDQQKENK